MFQESIAKEFLEKLVKWVKNIKISDPLEEGCRLGPVVSGGQVPSNYFLINLTKIFIPLLKSTMALFSNFTNFKICKLPHIQIFH